MILNLVGVWPAGLAKAVRGIEAALKKDSSLDLPSAVINLKLVDGKEIARLNKRYSGNAYPTDVLTFAYPENPGLKVADMSAEIADVAINQEMVAEQAQVTGSSLEEEGALLALHGILHAIGYDHQDEKSRDKMDRLQALTLKRAGMSYRDFNWSRV